MYRKMNEYSFGSFKGPKPLKKELQEVDGLFKQYAFFKKTREGKLLTTTCCKREEVLFRDLQRVMNADDYSIVYGKHNDRIKCPFCGREVYLKDIGRLGKRKGLEEYLPVLFLTRRKGKIFAIGAWAHRDYTGTLLPETRYKITRLYFFELGKAVMWESYCGIFKECVSQTTERSSRYRITEPLENGGYLYRSYARYYVIGLDKLYDSELKYCQYNRFRSNMLERYVRTHGCLIRYLALYSVYPKATEMFMKTGFDNLVFDYIFARKKNSIKWGADNPKVAFGIDGQEFREFIDNYRDVEVLKIYKELKKVSKKYSFELAAEINRQLPWYKYEFVKTCRKVCTEPKYALSYLSKRSNRCESEYVYWKDYLNAAKEIGYDLSVHNVLYPKNLQDAHDSAVDLQNRKRKLIEAEKNKELIARQEESLNRRAKKYEFEYEDYIIRLPRSETDIVSEGKMLSHCVGGYASRHMNDKLTILFLRRKNAPDEPFVTIEMQGDKLVQAHGYKNDRDDILPQDKYPELFKVWLSWVEGGSRRDEEGNPIIKNEKRSDAA